MKLKGKWRDSVFPGSVEDQGFPGFYHVVSELRSCAGEKNRI